MATYMLESQYYARSCTTPPDIMYAFYVTDLTALSANETWAPMYNMVVQEYTYGSCGYNIVLSKNCCYQTLDIELSEGYNSAMPTVIGDNIYQAMPVSAINIPYCAIESASQNSLFGYTHIFVSANGKCIANQFTCTRNQLTVYEPGSNCIGTNYTIPITNTKTLSTGNELLPSNAVWLLKTAVPTQDFSWVAYTPSKLLVTNSGMFGAYSFMMYGFCLVLTLYLVLESTLNIVKFPALVQTRLAFFSSINWVLFIIFKFIFVTYPFPNLMLMSLESEFMAVALNFATFAAMFNPYLMLAVMLGIKRKLKIWCIVMIIIAHLVLAGSNYFYYFREFPNEFNLIQANWNQLFIVYVFFLFLWNLVPQVFIAIKILFPAKEVDFRAKMQELHAVDPNFYRYVIMDILVFILYTVLYYLMNMTEILLNDYLYQAMFCYQDFFFLAHNLISIQVAKIVKKAFTNKGTAGESITRQFDFDEDDEEQKVSEMNDI
ncbi:hypothetical protein HK103_007571 [Boothiomyces macroporosus]|uniref:Uncharacterized protein n=1 Tax=Boothiomyces macroporosus TaxID=261099 RepID=A0AAD5Y692_9FUNG|nr:hypothetical protein HK103_007571 [Boothiomyces macroporosus]